MKVLVIGPGALGIVAAVKLHQAGYDTTVAVRSAAKAKRLAAGLRLRDVDGKEHRAIIPCIHKPGKDRFDLIIHTTKCNVAVAAMKKWLPALADDGWVVPFQNGVEGDTMKALVGDRFMECSVYWPATLLEEGYSHHTGAGNLVIGPWPDADPDQRYEAVAAVLRSIANTQVSAHMAGVKWSKLAINAAMTSCGVVSGATLGEMVRHKPSALAFLGVIRETIAVMDAAGIPVIRVGPSKPDLIAKLPTPLARLVLRAIARKYGNSRSSSAQSLARGQKTEVDYLNGRIVAEGERLGVATPINGAVVQAVRAIEAGGAQGFEAVEAMMANRHS